MYAPDEMPNEPVPDYQKRVVVKFSDDVDVPLEYPEMVAALSVDTTLWRGLADRGVTVRRLFDEVPVEQLQQLVGQASESDPSFRPVKLQNFIALDLPASMDASEALQTAASWPDVEDAYIASGPLPPPAVNSADDPRFASQGYLTAAPSGIDAIYAWGFPGGDGDGVRFIDLEQGWTLNHEDLSGAGITLISGLNKSYTGHGTAVLGEILAQDNTVGDVGIAPSVRARVVSQWRTGTNYDTGSAILSAIQNAQRGDVLLLEAQVQVGTVQNLPVEVEFATWVMIRVATAIGLVVVEAGGNGSVDLDTYQDPNGRYILKRGHADFRDSGAIMVGAASSAAPHTRMGFSNYGSRIDCYAWGQNIDTTGDGWTGNATNTYTPSFSGTSGASPIVTGAAIVVQGIAKSRTGLSLASSRVREILSDSARNTASANPAADRIGVMPNLRRIIDDVLLALPGMGDYPLPSGTTQVAAFIDPGHGGNAAAGSSSAYGCRGPRGSLEKNVNLSVAQRVRSHLGAPAALSRDGDHNLSLRERLAGARSSGAPVFLSIHSNASQANQRGSEIWVYGNAHRGPDHGSLELAHALRDELRHFDGRQVSVRTGDMALLHPGQHRAGVAACLVEVDYLSSQDGEARLTQPAHVDGVGSALARGVNRYLAGRRRPARR